MKRLCVSVSLGLLLAACQKIPPPTPSAPSVGATAPATASLDGADASKPAKPPAAMQSIDDYKILVARQILDANPNQTFSGQLPPMLPAIVVLNLSVDRDGKLSSVTVKRSRDNQASKVALAAVKRPTAPFPKPLHLLQRGHKTLDFSETFLFNEHYLFQLRSLAGPQ
ncbi:protein TonB [Oxalobacteraceae bacterium GrIS 1.11]